MCFTLRLCSGRILKIDSLFHYASGESFSMFENKEFKPLFLEDILKNMTKAEREKAEKTCGENKECIFDFAVTGRNEYRQFHTAFNIQYRHLFVILIIVLIITIYLYVFLHTYDQLNVYINTAHDRIMVLTNTNMLKTSILY